MMDGMEEWGNRSFEETNRILDISQPQKWNDSVRSRQDLIRHDLESAEGGISHS